MTRVRILLAALAFSAMAVSCTLEPLETPVQGEQKVVFTATAAKAGPGTKTTLVDDGPEIYWSPNDGIMIYSRNWGLTSSTSENTEPALTVEFPLWISSSAGAVCDENAIWALTPVNWASEFDGTGVKTQMPAFQTARAGTYDPAALLTVARTHSLSLAFYNVCGGLKFSVVEDNINFVEFRSNDETPLAGTVTVKMDDSGLPEVTEVADGTNTIYLSAPGGGCFEPGVWYYLVCLPAVLENGYTLTFHNDLGFAASLVKTDLREVKRSVWGALEEADAGLAWELPDEPMYNEIWYTTEDELPVDLSAITDAWYWGANIVSNVAANNICYLTFDGPVTKIYDWAFSGKGLTSVALPRSVTRIGDGAFNGNPGLVSVTLEEGLQEIGENAFQSCESLPELEIPGTVKKIGKGAFNICYNLYAFTGPLASEDGHSIVRDGELLAFAPGSEGGRPLSAYVIPEGVTRLGDGSFAWTGQNLQEVTLPASLMEVGEEVFVGCNSLRAFYGTFASEDGHLLVQDGEIKAAALAGVTDVTIPGTVDAIAPRAFYSTDIENLEIQEGLTKIGDEAFAFCGLLRQVTLPESLTDLGSMVFNGCSGLQSFSGKYASGDGCYLIRNGELVAVASGCVSGVAEIPNTVSRIAEMVFYNNDSITELVLPDSVTSIGDNAFDNCSNLQSIAFGNGLKTIGSGSFGWCTSLTELVLPESLESLGDYSFMECQSLADVYLPEGLLYLGWTAFQSSAITTITLPSSLSSMGGQVFDNCTNLEWVRIKADTPPSTNGFHPISSSVSYPIYVPAGTLDAYKTANCWENHAAWYVEDTE